MLFEEEKKEEIKILHCSVTRSSPLSKFLMCFQEGLSLSYVYLIACINVNNFCHYRRLTNSSLYSKISELSQKRYFQFFL